MSDLDDVVARVRELLARRDSGLPHADYDREDVEEMHGTLTYGDLRTLLAAYESAVRGRDEARKSRDQWMTDCDAEILAHRNTRVALRRVREGVEGMRIARYNESVVREGGKPTDTVYFAIEPEGDWVRYEDFAAVLALLDCEAPDA